MKVKPILILSKQLQKYNPKIITYVHPQTEAFMTNYKMKDESIPFITYEEGIQTLSIQVSIPKLLYGNNVQLLKAEDIPTFFTTFQERIKQLFDVDIELHEWKMNRLDVCWNFFVGENVEDYIQMFSKQKLPYKHTHCYNHKQTVVFQNKSSRIIFYDKQAQCEKDKEPAEIIKQAKGILRMEIKPSYHEMKKYSKERRAIDLLSEAFFTEVTKKTLNELEYFHDTEGMSLHWIRQNKEEITRIETYLGFQQLKNILDETTLKEIYKPATLANRKNLAKRVCIPKRSYLKRLEIDYNQVN